VQEKGQVVGIVTDRDLTVRVLGRGLEVNTTPLAEVMTTGVATLAPSDSQLSALRLMQRRNVRRTFAMPPPSWATSEGWSVQAVR